MGVFLADVQGFGQFVPVAPLEAVDDSRSDADRPQQEGESTGEVFTMAGLAVDQEVFDGVEPRVDDFHLQGITELAGFAEKAFESVGTRDDAVRAIGIDAGDDGLGDRLEPVLQARGHGQKGVVLGAGRRLV